jgi:hypothetical protein
VQQPGAVFAHLARPCQPSPIHQSGRPAHREGDTGGEVARAAQVAGLDKVLDAGPPPTVAITSHRPGSRLAADLVELTVRVTDRGKGVGRIEWRVNGVTAGVSGLPAGTEPERRGG